MQRQPTPNLLEAAALDGVIKAPNGDRPPPPAERVRRAYSLREDVVGDLEQIAILERYGVKQLSIIANGLLEVAIDLYQAGELSLEFVLESDGVERATFHRKREREASQ